jgi:DNA-binding response OmpR family regulator
MTDRSSNKIRLLAIDDDQDFLKALRMMLSPSFEVECLSGGEGLLEHLDILRPDLVLLDIHMPGTDGMTLCRQIRGDKRFSHIPVFFLTASKNDEDFLTSLEIGADSYITKPVRRQELIARLRNVLTSMAY